MTQCDDLVACCVEKGDQMRCDEAGGTGDQDSHAARRIQSTVDRRPSSREMAASQHSISLALDELPTRRFISTRTSGWYCTSTCAPTIAISRSAISRADASVPLPTLNSPAEMCDTIAATLAAATSATWTKSND